MDRSITKLVMKRILLIAEDGPTRVRMVALFEAKGYVVFAEQDSVEVLALIDRQAPHVIVLFAELSASLGLDVLHTLRKRRPHEVPPTILLAVDATLTLASDSDRPHMLSDQPISVDEVLAHVDKWLCK